MTKEPDIQSPAPVGEHAGRTCVIADDMPLMREVMRLRVEDFGMQVIGEAENGLDAVRIVTQLAPDLLIVDLNMEGMDGLQVIRRLVEMGSATRTLLYTADPRAQVVELALRAGANGCLNKSAGHDVLQQSVDTILAGGTFVDPNNTVPLPMPLRLAITPVDLTQAAHLADRL
ncbi:MAG: two-component regulator [Thermoleophilia bacterium]|nr:two-component regulator [Thermoleophilia bacterium]